MIYKANESDRPKLNEYLKLNAPLNLFFIGDIENNGFDCEYQKVWIDEDDQGIHGCLLKYRDSLCLMSYENIVYQSFVNNLMQNETIKVINGEESLIKLYDFPDYPKHEDCAFAVMREPNYGIDTSLVSLLTYDNLPELIQLENECFPGFDNKLENVQNSYLTHQGRFFGIFQDHKLVSAASSTAECSNLAMAVGVCTKKEYRARHYAKMCIAKLSNTLLEEGKTPCLFFNDPYATKIYHSLGYQDIGRWTMLKKSNNS